MLRRGASSSFIFRLLLIMRSKSLASSSLFGSGSRAVFVWLPGCVRVRGDVLLLTSPRPPMSRYWDASIGSRVSDFGESSEINEIFI